MATLASRSKLLSGLPSGTLAQHLAAISLGTGAVLVSQMTVCLDDPQVSLIDRTPPRLFVVAPAVAQATQGKKRIDVITRPAQIAVTTAPNTLHILQKTQRAQVVTTLPRLTVTRRPRITT